MVCCRSARDTTQTQTESELTSHHALDANFRLGHPGRDFTGQPSREWRAGRGGDGGGKVTTSIQSRFVLRMRSAGGLETALGLPLLSHGRLSWTIGGRGRRKALLVTWTRHRRRRRSRPKGCRRRRRRGHQRRLKGFEG